MQGGIDSVQASFNTSYEEYISNLLKYAPKILLVGHSGTGKSSCVNILFGLKIGDRNAASISHGKPCTQNFRIYGPSKSSAVRIIDSKGIEVMSAQEQFDEIENYIDEHRKQPIEDHVHLAYYFAPLSRWEKADTQLVKKLRKKVGIIIVINKCDIRTEEEIEAFKEKILREIGEEIHISQCGDPSNQTYWKPNRCPSGHFETIPLTETSWSCRFHLYTNEEGEIVYCSESGSNSPFGYQDLVRMSLEELPEIVRPSFISAQKVDLTHQHKMAAAAILTAVGSASATAATPLPFSDLIPLFLVESSMAAALMVIYGMPLKSLDAGGFITLNIAVIGVGGMLGKAVSGFLKMNVGYVAGATLDATIASTVVLAIGIAISVVLTRHVKAGTIRDEKNLDIFSEAKDILKNIDANELYKIVIQGSGNRVGSISQFISDRV